jgi:hypothetical protein
MLYTRMIILGAAFVAFTQLFLPGLPGTGSGFAAYALEEGGGDEVLDEGKHKITFDPFHLSLMKRGRVRGTVDIELVLQLHNNKEYEALNAMKPRLRADITAALSTLARQRWSLNRPIDPDVIRGYLGPVISHRVGEGKLEIYVLHALINPN